MAHQRFVCIKLPFQGGQFKRHIQCIVTHTESMIYALLHLSQISSAYHSWWRVVASCHVYSNFI